MRWVIYQIEDSLLSNDCLKRDPQQANDARHKKEIMCESFWKPPIWSKLLATWEIHDDNINTSQTILDEITHASHALLFYLSSPVNLNWFIFWLCANHQKHAAFLGDFNMVLAFGALDLKARRALQRSFQTRMPQTATD